MTVTFPALAVSPGDSFLVLAELPTTCSVRALQNGYFTRLYFLDAPGRIWPVRSFAAPHGFVDRLLNRNVPLRLELGDPVPADLALVVSDLCALIDRDPDDLYDQFVSHAELKRLLRAAASPPDLIRVAASLGASA